MQVLCKTKGDTATARLIGELDHHGAPVVRAKLEQAMADAAVCKMVLDLSALTFMDSAGIGVLLGRYRTLTARGGWLKVEKANPQIERILRMAGLYTILRRA